jgi:hypothetical protein
MLARTSALNRMGYNPRSSPIPKQCAVVDDFALISE